MHTSSCLVYVFNQVKNVSRFRARERERKNKVERGLKHITVQQAANELFRNVKLLCLPCNVLHPCLSSNIMYLLLQKIRSSMRGAEKRNYFVEFLKYAAWINIVLDSLLLNYV